MQNNQIEQQLYDSELESQEIQNNELFFQKFQEVYLNENKYSSDLIERISIDEFHDFFLGWEIFIKMDLGNDSPVFLFQHLNVKNAIIKRVQSELKKLDQNSQMNAELQEIQQKLEETEYNSQETNQFNNNVINEENQMEQEEEIQNLQDQQDQQLQKQQQQLQETTNSFNQEDIVNKFTEILQEAQQAYLKKLQGFQQTIQQQQKQLLIKNKKLLELQNKRKCSCCFEKIGKEIAFVPCGHIAYCENCCLDQFGYQQKKFKEYDNKLEQMGQCPICNQTIFDAIKIYEPTQIFTID